MKVFRLMLVALLAISLLGSALPASGQDSPAPVADCDDLPSAVSPPAADLPRGVKGTSFIPVGQLADRWDIPVPEYTTDWNGEARQVLYAVYPSSADWGSRLNLPEGRDCAVAIPSPFADEGVIWIPLS